MIARYRHRPGLVAGMQLCQETCSVFDIATRIEHIPDISKLITMIAMVDLHATEVDQALAFAPRILKGQECFRARAGKDGFSFYIQCVGLKAALVSGFRQPYGIEYAGGNLIAVGSAQNFCFAGV